MKEKPEWQKKTKKLTSKIFRNLKSKASETTDKIEKRYNISEKVEVASNTTKSIAKDLNDQLSITDSVNGGVDAASSALGSLKEMEVCQKVVGTAGKTKTAIDNQVVTPLNSLIDKTGIKNSFNTGFEIATDGYGKIRKLVKNYYAPETPEELLRTTKNELVYINACILQVSRDDAEDLANKFGAAITSKIAGVASAGALLSLIGTFGTAGTGTAISSLSGAAASNASLAWAGSLLGGGMATGALITGGITLAVGYSVYKLVGSHARQISELNETERRILESTGLLIAAINDVLKDEKLTLSIDDATNLLNETLEPLHSSLIENSDSICDRLDNKNAIAYRQHALVDFENKVLDGFKYYITFETKDRRERHPEFAIAGAVYALMTNAELDDSRETQLALEAIKRVRSDWNEDTPNAEIGERLASFNDGELRGMANNAKGIYHELLYVDNYNNSQTENYAQIHEKTNMPGSDIVIRDVNTDEFIAEYQLKATDSSSNIRAHFEKYPDIEVLATAEIAGKMNGIESTGINNALATTKVDNTIATLADDDKLSRVEDAAIAGFILSAGIQAIDVLKGKQDISKAGKSTLKSAGITAASTGVVALLFG